MSKSKSPRKLEIMAGMDRVTKLAARTTLEEEVLTSFNESIVEFDVSYGERRPYSVILFDVDYFKAINDLFGYQQGDAVLSGIGDVLRGYKRSKKDFLGMFGRWGGEEFLIALPYDPSRCVRYIADEIRELVASYLFEDARTRKRTLKDFITISAGVSSVDISDIVGELRKSGKVLRPEEIRKRLYQLVFESNCALDYAKFMGRNRVEVFENYLKSELQNLEQVRHFYFRYSPKKPSEVKAVMEHPFLQENRNIRNKVQKHFYMIRTEINPRDTRTQALLADNLYRHILERYPAQKGGFLLFIGEVNRI